MNNAIHAAWTPNAYFETWGQKCREDPKHLNTMSPANRIALLQYESLKRQAETDAEAVRQAQTTKR